MRMKPNLDKGSPMAKSQNSPKALPKTTRSNISAQTPMSKPANRPAPLAKNREGQTMRLTPTAKAPKAPDDMRIRGELTSSGGRQTGHSRKGR